MSTITELIGPLHFTLASPLIILQSRLPAQLTRVHLPFTLLFTTQAQLQTLDATVGALQLMESFSKCKDSVLNIVDKELNAFNQAVREELILRELAPLLSCTLYRV